MAFSSSPAGTSDNVHDHMSWSPERLMREYPEQPSGDILVRLAEHYTSREIRAKIDQYRDKPMHESNYYSLLKRCCNSLALRSGMLPGEFRLELDRRRVGNQTARGHKDQGLSYSRADVAKRDRLTVVELPDNPTPQQLANAHDGRDSRDRWFKLVASGYSEGELATAFKRTVKVFHDIINQGKHCVKAFAKWQELEAQGKAVPQTYIHPPLLNSPANLYTIQLASGATARSAIVVSSSPAKSPTKRTSPKHAKLLNTNSPKAKSNTGSSTSGDSVTVRLVSMRVRRSLYRLRDRLVATPSKLPALDRIGNYLETSLDSINGDSDTDRFADEGCETAASITDYRRFAQDRNLLDLYSSEDIAKCIVWAIDDWLEHVSDCEEEGILLSDTFLGCLTAVLSNVEEAQATMAANLEEHDEDSEDFYAAYG